jgi:hypothetical protein
MLVFEFGGLHNTRMMNALTTPETPETIKWSKRFNELSQEGKFLYTSIYDYCTYHPDPQYQRLHEYRKQISKLEGADRDILIEFFNNDPAIRWNGIPEDPYTYYKKDYYS